MPVPKEICLEDLAAASLGGRYLHCVAVSGAEPGLAVDARGAVVWRSAGPVACELWVSADERLVLLRREGAPAVRVARAGRALDVPVGKPVVLIDQDDLEVAGRALRVHVHGLASVVTPPAFVPEALLRGAQTLGAAVATAAAVAGCAVPGERAAAPDDAAVVVDAAAPSAAPATSTTAAPSASATSTTAAPSASATPTSPVSSASAAPPPIEVRAHPPKPVATPRPTPPTPTPTTPPKK